MLAVNFNPLALQTTPAGGLENSSLAVAGASIKQIPGAVNPAFDQMINTSCKKIVVNDAIIKGSAEASSDVLAKHFAQISPGNEYPSLGDLKLIANGTRKIGETPAEQRKVQFAADFFVNNPEQFKKMETTAYGGTVSDNKFGFDDLVSARAAAADATGGAATADTGGAATADTGGAATADTGGAATADTGGAATADTGGASTPDTGGASTPDTSTMGGMEASQVLKDNFDTISGGAEDFTINDLKNLAEGRTDISTLDPAKQEIIKKAATYFTTHPDELKKLDTAAKGGDADAMISRYDFSSYMNAKKETTIYAGKVLADSLDLVSGGDGTISVDDLKAIAIDSRTGEAVKAAAQYFLDNPEQFTAVDGIRGGAPDGFIGKEDLDVLKSMGKPGQTETRGGPV